MNKIERKMHAKIVLFEERVEKYSGIQRGSHGLVCRLRAST